MSNTEKDTELKEVVAHHSHRLEPGPDIDPDKFVEKLTPEEALAQLDSSKDGLKSSDAAARLQEIGPNKIQEEVPNPILQFLKFLWNPLSWAMEAAVIVTAVLQDWADLGLILGLLFFNACIGYWEEKQAGNAIAALKAQMAPNANAKRDGAFKQVPAEELVPGDVILLRLGDVIPADCKLIEGDNLKVDQSSLTGESLPVTKFKGHTVLSGSVIKQGEMEAMVYATGEDTFFGRAAHLVSSVPPSGHFQRVLTQIGLFAISFIVCWIIVELIVQFGGRGKPCSSLTDCHALNNILVLIVGGIPIAMPTVLSVTMAIGAYQLAKKQAIVSRLTAVEELAGMDVLCSDKTGTLTQNKLTIDQPVLVQNYETEELMLCASLASKVETNDAIDVTIVNGFNNNAKLATYKVEHFVPFDPIGKKTVATVRDPEGRVFKTAKGAPQVILDMSENKTEIQAYVEKSVEELAGRGLRALGVARSTDAEGQSWKMLGIIPLFDPPRHDTKVTIEKAMSMGIRVKMITGDQVPIAKETARRLGMGDNILQSSTLPKKGEDLATAGDLVEKADGFGQVFPEHKFEIVKILQGRGHVCGMTGDGVNDAPALKVADIGIAVAGATDAARAAADIVLISPGLGVIIDAIIGSRKIFQRMRNYATYSIASTLRIVLTFGILTVAWDFYFPTLVTVVIAILNDGTIMTISKDKVQPSPFPDRWNLVEIFTLAFGLAGWLVGTTLLLFTLAKYGYFADWFGLHELSDHELRGLIYLYVSVSAQALIFVTRTRGWWFLSRPSNLLMIAFVFAQTAATFIGVYGFNGYPNDDETNFEGCGWGYALLVWIFAVIMQFPLDPIKFAILSIIDKHTEHLGFDLPNVIAPTTAPATEHITFGHPYYGARPSISDRPRGIGVTEGRLSYATDRNTATAGRTSFAVERSSLGSSTSSLPGGRPSITFARTSVEKKSVEITTIPTK